MHLQAPCFKPSHFESPWEHQSKGSFKMVGCLVGWLVGWLVGFRKKTEGNKVQRTIPSPRSIVNILRMCHFQDASLGEPKKMRVKGQEIWGDFPWANLRTHKWIPGRCGLLVLERAKIASCTVIIFASLVFISTVLEGLQALHELPLSCVVWLPWRSQLGWDRTGMVIFHEVYSSVCFFSKMYSLVGSATTAVSQKTCFAA